MGGCPLALTIKQLGIVREPVEFEDGEVFYLLHTDDLGAERWGQLIALEEAYNALKTDATASQRTIEDARIAYVQAMFYDAISFRQLSEAGGLMLNLIAARFLTGLRQRKQGTGSDDEAEEMVSIETFDIGWLASRCQRFYGGPPLAWYKMPFLILRSYIENLPKLTASEHLSSVGVLNVHEALKHKESSVSARQTLNEWEREARNEQPEPELSEEERAKRAKFDLFRASVMGLGI